MRAYWIKIGHESCKNKDADVAASERQHKHQKRYFSKTLFKRKLTNGETQSREWLLYSPSTGTVFCFACKLFGDSDIQAIVTGKMQLSASLNIRDQRATERQCSRMLHAVQMVGV